MHVLEQSAHIFKLRLRSQLRRSSHRALAGGSAISYSRLALTPSTTLRLPLRRRDLGAQKIEVAQPIPIDVTGGNTGAAGKDLAR